jgi:hypothetical protein
MACFCCFCFCCCCYFLLHRETARPLSQAWDILGKQLHTPHQLQGDGIDRVCHLLFY